MRAFVCGRCGRHEPDPYKQFTERVELRRLDGRNRAFVYTAGYVCAGCVGERVRELKGEPRSSGQLPLALESQPRPCAHEHEHGNQGSCAACVREARSRIWVILGRSPRHTEAPDESGAGANLNDAFVPGR